VYTVNFYKNDTTEKAVTLTGDLAQRTDYSPFRDIKVNNVPMTRDAGGSAHASDHNFYYNTTRRDAILSVNLDALVANSGYQLYYTNMTSYDGATGETIWTPMDNPDSTKLILTEDDSWYTLMATDGINRFYASVTIYSDPLGRTSTKLDNLTVSNPTVPLFRDDVYEYFVAAEAGTDKAHLIARATRSDTYISQVRVRAVGGEYLMDNYNAGGNTLTDAAEIPLHHGKNRLTITVKTILAGTTSTPENVQKRVYEVEIYRAGETVYLKDGTLAATTEQREDTGDIIWMDYTSGGSLTSIWNSELVNYFLSYPYFSNRPQKDQSGKPIIDSTGNYVYQLNDSLTLTATHRPEENDRAAVSVRRTDVNPITGDKTFSNPVALQRNADGTWTYDVATLAEGETQLIFTVQVTGDKVLANGVHVS
ncbi:MAG: hypothetical protein RRY53_07045, partial [Pseudoflavonifractor sp.]